MRVAVVDDTAYYVYQDQFWQAPFDVETGSINKSAAVPIDFSVDLTTDEINWYFEILDSLEEQ